MLIYLHGFNSSPESRKAQLLASRMQASALAAQLACPQLPHRPSRAIAVIEEEMAKHAGETITFIGSSLGGFYATWLAEKHDAKAVLINPAINPQAGLRALASTQQNLYTGERYELTEEHFEEWARLVPPRIMPARYLLLVETGDEVLDYREALERYRGCQQVVVEGGDHTLRTFPEHIPRILAFAGLGADEKPSPTST
ncbi:MAG: esterase [Betaproteobacteria bacterium]|nr:esterase [Betaproteobacteria bacterium]